MGNRQHFTLAFVSVALGALLAYGAIVYVASMIALGEIRQEAAMGQWQLFQRALAAKQADQMQLTEEYAEREEMRQIVRAAPAAAAGLGQSMVPALQQRHQIALLTLANAAGALLYPIGPASTQTLNALQSEPARSALSGASAGDLIVMEDQIFLLTAASVGTGGPPDVEGILILARPLDDAFLGEVKAIMGSDLVLAREGQVVASSRALSRREEEERRQCSGSSQSDDRRLDIQTGSDGGDYVVVPLVSASQGDVGCLQLDISNHIVPTMRAAITIASLVAILLGVAASYILARAVGSRLARASEALAAGERENARLYAEVQQLNSRLETLVGERTMQLHAAVSELQTTQAQLTRSDRLATLGSLTIDIVSELSAALTTVLGYVQALLRSEDNAERRASLEQVRKIALEKQDVLRRLRAFAGQQRARREWVDMNDVVRGAFGLLTPALQAANIEYDLRLADPLPKIMADQTQMHQVVLSLLQRARQAAESAGGPGQLRVQTQAADEVVRLSVVDNGPTPDAAALGRLFDAAPLVDAPGRSSASLYVCRAIVEAHGGQISAQPRPDGPGLVVTVELPAGAGPKGRGA